MEDTLHQGLVGVARSMHVKTDLLNNILQVGARQSQVLQSAHNGAREASGRPEASREPGTPRASRAPGGVQPLRQPAGEKLDPWRGGHSQSREAAQEKHASGRHRERAKPQHPKVPAETEKPSHQSKRVGK